MAKMNKLDRRGSGPLWFLTLAIVLYAMYSMAVAYGTWDTCDAYGGDKVWRIIPPEWDCQAPRR
jgi:hypothetical protein